MDATVTDQIPVKRNGYNSNSLGAKIATIISLALIIVFLFIAKWIEVKQTATIFEASEQESLALAETLHTGLRTLMLNGNGELTNEWLESIEKIGGIVNIQVVRMDGSQAFRDLSTLQSVNNYLGSETFHRKPIAEAANYDRQEHIAPLAEVSQTMKSIKLHDDSAKVMKLWMPIEREEACNLCHGYETGALRGLLHVEVSTANQEADIINLRKVLWLSALLVALVVGVILWLLLRKIVLRPVDELCYALDALGQGNTDVSMPVDREDEFGDVARSFMALEKHWAFREARLNLILNNIPEAVITVSPSGDIIRVNRAASLMFGYDEPQLLEQNLLKLLGPVSGDQLSGEHRTLSTVQVSDLVETMRECVGFHKEKGVFPVEVEVRKLDVDYLVMLSDINLYDLEKSNKYLFFLRDMSVRRRTEADMRTLATVVDQASEAIVICNPEGIIEYVNPAFYETTGYTIEEAIGNNPSMLKSGDRGDKYYKEMWDNLKSGEVWRDVFINKRKDGTLYQSEQRIAPMHDSFGNISHYVSIQRDITKEKGLQEQVEHLQRLESLGVLAGGIAHDFNNILACVVGNAEVMSYEIPEDSSLHEYIGFIQEASTRGESLCRELMAYAGKGTRKTEAVNLSDIVKGISNILDATASKQIHITVDMPAEPVMIMADQTQLEQVVMNLVINATEAMPEGRGHVEISINLTEVNDNWFKSSNFHSEVLQPGVYACLTVADDGCGMDNVTVNQIFDPFFTTKFTGRGLGMSAVLGIIQNHHGSIRCNSEVGVGTTFSVVFPLLNGVEISAAKEPEKSVGMSFKGSGTVLVIDDEPVVAKVASRMLETMGYQTEVVHDAREAFALLDTMEVVAIMVDMSMPHMDGPSFIRTYREKDMHVPIVVCSGDAGEDVRSRIDESMVSAIVSKPFRLNDLVVCFSSLHNN